MRSSACSSAVAFLLFLLTQIAAASNSGITYQGRIVKPDGSPLSGQFTQFKLQLRTPDSASCLMYEEVQSQDLRNSNGVFSITINDGSGSRLDSSGLSLDRIFANRGSFSLDPLTCATGAGTWVPNAGDGRNLVVLFKDETMSTWEPIPPQKINFVPLAFESKQIAGFTADSLLRVVNGSGDPLTGLAPLSNAQYTELLALVNGTSNAFTRANQLGGVTLPTMTSGEVLGWNGSAWVSQPAVAGANSVTTSMIQNNAVDGSKIANGAVGTSQIASNASINTSGTLSSAVTTTRDFKIYAASPSNFSIGMQAPALTASYALTWPMDDGNTGDVLTTDGSGVMSWTPVASSQWTTQAPGINYMGGNVGIGTTSPTYSLQVVDKRSDPTIATAAGRFVSQSNLTTNTGVWHYGTSSSLYHTIGSGTALSGAFIGTATSNSVAAGSGGSLSSLHGMYNTYGVASGATTSVANTYGIYSRPLLYSGSITNNYGIFLANKGAGATVANSYGIYQQDADDRNYFAGKVGIGTTSPGAILGVDGVKAGTGTVTVGAGSTTVTGAGTSFTTEVSVGDIINISGEERTVSAVTNANNLDVSSAFNLAYSSSAFMVEKASYFNAGPLTIGGTSRSAIHSGSALFANVTPQVEIQGGAASWTGYSDLFVMRHHSPGYYNVSAPRQLGFLMKLGDENSVGASDLSGGIMFESNKAYTATPFLSLVTANQRRLSIDVNGNVGIGTTSPTAVLNLRAGTASAGTAPLKFTSGTLLTTPEDGAMEYNSGSGLWFTIGSTRYVIPTNMAAGNYSNVSTISNAAGSITMTPMAGNSVIINQSTTSTNSTSGALVVNGGAGIGGALNTGGNIVSGGSITATTNAVIPQIYGATAASGNIRIDGTSNASPGNVLLATIGGNVGIGTTAPSGALHIKQSSTTSGIKLEDASTSGSSSIYYTAGADLRLNRANTSVDLNSSDGVKFVTGGATERMRIDASGNVGIGTTSPGYLLDLSKSQNSVTALNVTNSSTSAGAAASVSVSNGTKYGSLYVSSSAAGALYADRTSFDTDGAGFNFFSGAPTGDIRFFTSGYSAAKERLRIDSTGKVGIGTTSPGYALEVVGTVKVNTGDVLLNSSGAVKWTGASDMIAGNGTSHYLAISTNSSERMRIDSSGNVGIGTTSPTTALDVNGNITTNGQLVVVSAGRIGLMNGSDLYIRQQGAARFQTSASVDLVTITQAGSVGIGTTSPTSILHAVGTSPTLTLQDSANLGLFTYSQANANQGVIRSNASSGAIALDINPTVSDGSSAANLRIFRSTSTSGGRSLQIYRGDNTATLDTQLSAGASAVSFIAANGGNVGIGTTSPAQTLSVEGSAYFKGGAGVGSVADGTRGTLRVVALGGSNIADFEDNTATSKMTITGAGNVGIGTTAPTQNLSVVGTGYAGAWGVGAVADGTKGQLRVKGGASDALSNALYVENLAPSPLFVVRNDGNVGVGSTSPAYKLDVAGDINSTSCFRVGATTVGGTCSSDARLKDHVADYKLGLTDVLNLKVRTYEFNGLGEMPKTGERAVGVIAQEVEKSTPQLVKPKLVKMRPGDADQTEIKAVDYSQFTYMLINAVKEFYSEWRADRLQIQKEISQLKAANESLRKSNEELRKVNLHEAKRNVEIRNWICVKDPKASLCREPSVR